MNAMCHAAPYMGSEKFIYVHHHKSDENAAFTLIEKLAREGYRIWYPTRPINTELVTERVFQCAVFMPLYSDTAVQSHDFRKVITAAAINGGEIAPVFLQDTLLSVGMKLQFEEKNRTNWYDVREMFDAKEAALKACKGKPDPSIRVIERGSKEIEESAENKETPKIRITTFIDEEEILQKMKRNKEEREAAQHKVEEEQCKAEEAARLAAQRRAARYASLKKPLKEEQPVQTVGERKASATVIIEEELPEIPKKRFGGTVIIEEMPPILVRMNTGEVFEGRIGVTTVGRTDDNDICIPADTVSSRHMEIIARSDAGVKNLIRDCNSSNGTWIGGQKMERGENASAESYIQLSLSRQEPCVVIFGELAQQIREKGVLACLECRETREMQLLLEDETTVGRHTCWEKGAFNEEHISGKHAVFVREKNGFTIKDISSNGTRINGGSKIPRNIPMKISSGDEIRMGYQNFVFTCIALKEK